MGALEWHFADPRSLAAKYKGTWWETLGLGRLPQTIGPERRGLPEIDMFVRPAVWRGAGDYQDALATIPDQEAGVASW